MGTELKELKTLAGQTQASVKQMKMLPQAVNQYLFLILMIIVIIWALAWSSSPAQSCQSNKTNTAGTTGVSTTTGTTTVPLSTTGSGILQNKTFLGVKHIFDPSNWKQNFKMPNFHQSLQSGESKALPPNPPTRGKAPSPPERSSPCSLRNGASQSITELS